MGTLYLVATPIGNLDDITIRAIKTLFSVDYIACEDTRKTGQLIKNLEAKIQNSDLFIRNLNISKKPKLISYYDEIESTKIPDIISLLAKDKNVALVSNCGTPLISDPGFKLIKESIKKEVKIISIPGPSSVLVALTSSGLPPDKFLFLGFLPAREGKRKKLLSELFLYLSKYNSIFPTVIFFESPHRLKASLSDLKEVFGDINVVIARELTKLHEEIYKSKISCALRYFSSPKGEMIVLFTLKK